MRASDHKETMSSSSAMQTVFLIAAIASQAAAFNPSRAMSVHRISTPTSSLKYLHNLPPSYSERNSEQLSMSFNFGRNKGKKGKSETTAMQSSTAGLEGISKSESKNPITRWIQSVAWPSKKELKKLLPLGTMLFFILFNYTILRDTKVMSLH